MPTELISVGPVTNLLANVVYALPASPCTITAGAVLQKSTSFAGTYSDWIGSNSGVYHQGGGHCKCVSNTTVTAVKQKMKKYDQLILADIPVSYWKLDETSGLVAKDFAGGRNGTISGGVTLNQIGALQDGKAMLFDGLTGQITAPAGILNFGNGAQSWSIEVWINGQYVADGLIFQEAQGCFNSNGIGFALWHSGPSYWCFGRTALGPATRADGWSTYPIPGQWTQLVGVYDANAKAISVAVNGVIVKNLIISGNDIGNYTDTYSLFFGKGDWAFSGYMDNITLYPKALTPAQILKHYQARS